MQQQDERGRYTSSSDVDPLWSDPLIADWLEDYRSEGTKRRYFHAFKNFVRYCGITTQEFHDLSEDEARELFIKRSKVLERQGKSNTGKAIQDACKSFWKFHHRSTIVLRRSERIRQVRKRLSEGKEHIPKPDEIYEMIRYATGKKVERNRAIIMVLYETGVRVNALQDFTLGMFKSFLYPTTDAPIKILITLEIDTKLRAYNIPFYHTYIAQDGCEYLKNYIDKLLEENPHLPDDYKLFDIHKTQILRIVKRLASNRGIPKGHVWTHLLRKSFRRVLNNSTLDEDTKDYLFGHVCKGSRENYFDRADTEIRAKYSRLNLRGETEEAKVLKIELEKERKLRTDLVSQLPQIIHLEVEKRVKASLDVMRARGEIQSTQEPTYETTIVPDSDLQGYLDLIEQGWKREDRINGQLILKRAIKATIPTTNFGQV